MKLITVKLFKEHTGRLNINSDVIMTGIKTYITKNNFDELFKFITLYVQRLYSDPHLQKCLQKNVNRIFLEMISPSDIAYVLALIKNGKGGWDQDLRMAQHPHGGGEKKVPPLFTSGKGKKRMFGKSMRTWEGLEYFYLAEKNWKEVYTTKTLYSRLCTEWEHCELVDTKFKDPV
jgi:hypothetical protein